MITIMSLWRNDADRDLEVRVEHLLSKSSSRGLAICWLWITGDNDDDTEARLRRLVRMRNHPERDQLNVRIVRHDTDIVGIDAETRRCRGRVTASAMFRHLEFGGDDCAILHESDLVTPADIVDELIDTHRACEALTGEPTVVAGWPMIEIAPGHPQFYDIWAYRDLCGVQFSPKRPFAQGWNRNLQPFEVGSLGSVWLTPTALLYDRTIEAHAVLELCEQWRVEGVRLWADPRIKVIQPIELWERS